MKLSIIIPAYNEEKSIAEVIERVLRERSRVKESLPQIDYIELIVVNDGSTDNTGIIAAGYKEIVLINREKNYGYGAALKCGFENAGGEIISFLDVDQTYPPEELWRLCKELMDKRLDLVVGSRISQGRGQMSWIRFLGNKFFAYLLAWITHKRITDAASGMWVFRKDILKNLYPLPDGMNFPLVITLKAIFEGLKFCEIPITYRQRVGKSKLKVFRDGLIFLSSIIHVTETYNPLKFFGMVGFILILIAMVYGIQPLFYYLSTKTISEGMIYRLLSIMVLINIGLIAISLGILSNYIISFIRNKKIKNTRLNNLLYNRLMPKIGLLGIFLVFLGLAINYKTIYQYVAFRQIYVHWSYLVTGALFILSGIQFYMLGTLGKILRALNEIFNRQK